MVIYHLSRLSETKREVLPLDDSFPDENLIAFLQGEVPRYAHLVDDIVNCANEIEEEVVFARAMIP